MVRRLVWERLFVVLNNEFMCMMFVVVIFDEYLVCLGL